MNMFKSLKMPSRNTTLFALSVTGLAGVRYYDKQQIDHHKSKLFAKCTEIANQPMAVSDLPRKVIMYTNDTKYSREWFNEYVKPFLDKAALDYDVHSKPLERVAESVRENMWNAKDYYKKGTSAKEVKKGYIRLTKMAVE
jgi:c-di-AMP phosphodiesterase-like protein